MRNRHREAVVRRVLSEYRSEVIMLLFQAKGLERRDLDFDDEFERLCDLIRLPNEALTQIQNDEARDDAKELEEIKERMRRFA